MNNRLFYITMVGIALLGAVGALAILLMTWLYWVFILSASYMAN